MCACLCRCSIFRCMVEHIGLLTTVVRRRDGIKLWLPNARLAAEPLPNVSRSEKRWEGFKACRSLKLSRVLLRTRKCAKPWQLDARLAAAALPDFSRSRGKLASSCACLCWEILTGRLGHKNFWKC